MSDNTTKKNTTKRIEIPISIFTEFHTSDEIQEAKMRVEQTAFHIGACFWFMKTVARGHDLLELQTDSKLFTTNEFTGNVDLLCQIGEGLADSLEMHLRPLLKAAREIQKQDQTAVGEPVEKQTKAGGEINE